MSAILSTPIEPDPRRFEFWLMTARPGEEFIYHVGDLMFDREQAEITGTHDDPDPVERIKAQVADAEFAVRHMVRVDAMARAAWAAHEAGRVLLFQRRLGPGYWAYVARKRQGFVEHAFKQVA